MSESLPLHTLGIVGGSGFYQMPELKHFEKKTIKTPYGPVVDLVAGEIAEKRVYFIARHGVSHSIPPHKINYRANLWALYELGVDAIVSVNAVGGIASNTGPNTIVVPDQIIDYTSGREHTYAEPLSERFNHVDFTWPFSEPLRCKLLQHLISTDLVLVSGGVYGVCQGPRLETAAEILRLERDGCTIVGMTAMPEAALARELNVPYACVCPVVNWAAGKAPESISLEEINSALASCIPKLRQAIVNLLQSE